jgi:thioredoxin 1
MKIAIAIDDKNTITKGDVIMGKGVLEIEDNNFDSEVLQSDKPVLVDFWAPWCGPCKAIGPAVEKLAETYGDEFRFAKCNVDLNPATPGKYGIRAIPTLLLFKQGQLVDKIIGAVPPIQIEEALKKILSGAEPAAPFIVR